MKIELPYPHKGQRQIRRQAKRFNWLSAGRRWRKTTLVMAIAVENAAKGQRIIWGAPTYQQVRIGLNETKRAAGNVAEFNLSRMEAVFPSGGIIIYRSLDDADNARGETADGVVIDETGDVKAEAWYEVLRPMLIDAGGWLWAIGTPKGRNWFFNEHITATDKKDSATWQVPTLGVRFEEGKLIRHPHPLENPNVSFDEVVSLWETMPERTFRQEILAEFTENENSVFRNLAACMGAPPAKPEDHRGHRIVIGCDWAKQSDYSCFSIGCIDCRCEVDRDRFNKIDYAFQVQRLKAKCDSWKPIAILTELNSIGQPIFEQLQRMRLPVIGFETTASTKPPLIENLALTLERTEWQFQSDSVWTNEMESYERKVSATTGRSSYGAPEGLHDDTVIARALMAWQSRQYAMATAPMHAKTRGW